MFRHLYYNDVNYNTEEIMPKSIRLDKALEEKVDRAARELHLTHSAFIREALNHRCQEVLGETLHDRLAPGIGVYQSGGGRAEQTGKAFRAALRKKSRS